MPVAGSVPERDGPPWVIRAARVFCADGRRAADTIGTGSADAAPLLGAAQVLGDAGGRATFLIASDRPAIYSAKNSTAYYQAQAEGGAPALVDEWLRANNLTRFNCPYSLLFVFRNSKINFPSPSGARPINGWQNEGGGMAMFSLQDMLAFNFQSTLQHELGHSFDLPHVDAYGYDMNTNPSIMSYSQSHWTNYFQDSSTPGILIPEDIRSLAENKLAFPSLTFTSADMPAGYRISPIMIILGPMNLPNPPDYTTPGQYFSSAAVTQTVMQGQAAVFVVSTKGIEPSAYQWRHNSLPIPGATGTFLSIGSARPEDGGQYSVTVTSTSGTLVSNSAMLTVKPLVAPSSAAVSPATVAFESQGGEGTVSLNVEPANANWNASSNAAWLSVLSGASGTGSWQLTYSVAPNPSPTPRTGQIAVAGATFSVSQAGVGADTAITIVNPGFETLPSNPKWIDCSGYGGPGCRYTDDGNVPGWIASGVSGSGLLQMGPRNLFTLPLRAAEGQTIVQINSGTLSQTVTATLEASTKYTLQVDVGRRLDNVASSPSPTVQLFAGNTQIALATGPQPPLGGWTTWTATHQSDPSDARAGQALRIVLGGTTPVQGDFDNVRLTKVSAQQTGAAVPAIQPGGSFLPMAPQQSFNRANGFRSTAHTLLPVQRYGTAIFERL
jgi:hypothetical protein